MKVLTKPISGFEGKYSVTSDGRVHSDRYNRFLTPGISMWGYHYVCLGRNNQRMVAKLVAETFIGPIPDGYCVDHINLIKTDNRVENLRYSTNTSNQWNKPMVPTRNGKNNSSMFKGVYRHPQGGPRPWVARICQYGKQRHLGCFESDLIAAEAYDAAAIVLFGEFAKTNHDLGLL